jgi:hypothetical protein
MTKGRQHIILLAGGWLLLVIIAFGCTSQPAARENTTTTAVQDSIAVVPFETGGGWGYSVNVGARPYIYQDIIPALPGRNVFKSRADALRVGNRVAEKMRSNQLPTISKEELVEMGIVK